MNCLHQSPPKMTSRALAFGLAAFALLLSACATSAPPRQPAVFFPPPPGLPRIQFLTSFNGLRDVTKQSGFDRFVVGEQPDLRLDKPYGVAIYDGRIYVCDTNAGVVVFDLKAGTYGPLAGAVEAGRLAQPVNISIEADGTKYVSDPARGQVVVFDRDDQFVRAVGVPGDWRPVDAVAFEDRLYVVDNANAVVRVFDKASGEPIRTIGDQGEPEDRLARPTNLAIDAKGYLYVSDVAKFQILKFDRDGHLESTIGKLGDNLGHFARPKGVALDREGRLYAVDASFNNVQIFNREGRLLMFFGQPGEQPGDLSLPAKVTIDYDNIELFRDRLAPGFRADYLILVTSQFGPRQVNVFAYGQDTRQRYPTDSDLQKELEAKRKKELAKELESPPKP